MDVSFSYFINAMAQSPVLLITVLLTLGVIFVNGWTDAPNAIATCITTRCMRPRPAILLSAAFNFLGRAGDDPHQQFGGLYHQQHGGFRRRHPRGPHCPVRRPVLHCGVQRCGLYVWHSHQRKPQPDRRPFRRGHRHPKRRRRHQYVTSG